jgi:uncharacterized DUF497 family protein
VRKPGFIWDEAKAESNFIKHGVSFEAAQDIFVDPFAIEQLDDREDYGEERYAIVGLASDWSMAACCLPPSPCGMT